MENNYGFFALLDRMQYINRWALMRNSRYENLKEHSFDVAVVAEALAVIHNKLVDDGKTVMKVDPLKASSLGLYHDCTEIITGDMPTPIKYRNSTIKSAYREVEHESAESLVSQLPDYMQDIFNQAGGNFGAVGNIVSAGMNIHIGIFKSLDKKIQAAPPKKEDSAVLLRTSPARNGTKPPLLLVSPKMLQNLSESRGLSPSQIVIWSGLTASNIKEQFLTDDRKMIYNK